MGLAFDQIQGLKDYLDDFLDLGWKPGKELSATAFALELGWLCYVTVCKHNGVGLVLEGNGILHHEGTAFENPSEAFRFRSAKVALWQYVAGKELG